MNIFAGKSIQSMCAEEAPHPFCQGLKYKTLPKGVRELVEFPWLPDGEEGQSYLKEIGSFSSPRPSTFIGITISPSPSRISNRLRP